MVGLGGAGGGDPRRTGYLNSEKTGHAGQFRRVSLDVPSYFNKPNKAVRLGTPYKAIPNEPSEFIALKLVSWCHPGFSL